MNAFARKLSVLSVVGAALSVAAATESRVPTPQPVSGDYYVACHYFPGWGVKKNGYSMFKDVLDFPDRMPLIGCYDEGDPEVADWQVKWAREPQGHDFALALTCHPQTCDNTQKCAIILALFGWECK